MSFDHNYQGHPLLNKLDSLLSHLNSEENDMAFEFATELQEACKRLDKLDALEAGGVDNWQGYGDCFGDEDE